MQMLLSSVAGQPLLGRRAKGPHCRRPVRALNVRSEKEAGSTQKTRVTFNVPIEVGSPLSKQPQPAAPSFSAILVTQGDHSDILRGGARHRRRCDTPAASPALPKPSLPVLTAKDILSCMFTPHGDGVITSALFIRLQTQFGQNVGVVGSFNGWDVSAPLPLTWTHGSVWRGEAVLAAGYVWRRAALPTLRHAVSCAAQGRSLLCLLT